MANLTDLVRTAASLWASAPAGSDHALLSLRVGLRSYFSTYNCYPYCRIEFRPTGPSQQWHGTPHSPKYAENSMEAILHFQHFTELACKSILREEHLLLADEASSKPVILYKLLKGMSLNTEEEAEVKSIEFTTALNRLCTLIEAGLVDPCKYGFIKDDKMVLESLNGLRNRLWHRGIFVLRYDALDEFIGKYFFPLMGKLVSLPWYAEHETYWRYEPLACGLDPITEIQRIFQEPRYDFEAVALLKELGRAALLTPPVRSIFTLIDSTKLDSKAEGAAAALADNGLASRVLNCPVCNKLTLAVLEESESGWNSETNTEEYFYYVSAVECMYCTFSMDNSLGIPVRYRQSIPDYWAPETN